MKNVLATKGLVNHLRNSKLSQEITLIYLSYFETIHFGSNREWASEHFLLNVMLRFTNRKRVSNKSCWAL